MEGIKVEITRITSADQPGFVECKLKDAWEKVHVFEEKIPIVSNGKLWIDTEFTTFGTIPCEFIKEFVDKNNRKLISVSTKKLYDIISNSGIYEFDIWRAQLCVDISKFEIDVMQKLLKQLRFQSDECRSPIQNMGFQLMEVAKFTTTSREYVRKYLKLLIDNGYLVLISTEPLLFEFSEKGKLLKSIDELALLISNVA